VISVVRPGAAFRFRWKIPELAAVRTIIQSNVPVPALAIPGNWRAVYQIQGEALSGLEGILISFRGKHRIVGFGFTCCADRFPWKLTVLESYL